MSTRSTTAASGTSTSTTRPPRPAAGRPASAPSASPAAPDPTPRWRGRPTGAGPSAAMSWWSAAGEEDVLGVAGDVLHGGEPPHVGPGHVGLAVAAVVEADVVTDEGDALLAAFDLGLEED